MMISTGEELVYNVNDTQKAREQLDDSLNTLNLPKSPSLSSLFGRSKKAAGRVEQMQSYYLDYAPFVALHLIGKLKTIDLDSIDAPTKWQGKSKRTRRGSDSSWKSFGKERPSAISFQQFVANMESMATELFNCCNRNSKRDHQAAGLFLLKNLCTAFSTLCKLGKMPQDCGQPRAKLYSKIRSLLEYTIALQKKYSSKRSSFLLNEETQKHTLLVLKNTPEEARKNIDPSYQRSVSIKRDPQTRVLQAIADALGRFCANDNSLETAVHNLPHLSLMKDLQANFTQWFGTEISKEIEENINQCIQNLLQRSEKELETSNEWFRKSVQKSQISKIEKLGISKWIKDNNGENPSPFLVASYLKVLLRSIGNGLLNRSIQDLLIFLTYGGSQKTNTTAVEAIHCILIVVPSRRRVLSQLGKVALLIFEKSLVKITPSDLAVILPVGGELDENIDSNFASQTAATEEISTRMEYLKKWNYVFGVLLANSDYFFEEKDMPILKD